MNNKFIPALSAGFATAVLSTVPGLKNAACCLFIPLASVFAVFLYTRMNLIRERIKPGQGVLLGFLTGFFGALLSTTFETTITFVTKTNEFIELLPQTELAMRELNMGELMEQSIDLLRQMAVDIRTTGFSFLYTSGLLFSNLFTYILFGILGGLLSILLVNRKNPPSR